MARTVEIVSVLQNLTGKRFDEISLLARRLREEGLWVRETRSPNSPRPTARHVAHLILAILHGGVPKAATRAVKQYAENYEYQSDSRCQEGLREAVEEVRDVATPLLALTEDGHSLVDAVEALIKTLMNEPGFIGEALTDNDEWETTLTIDNIRGTASLYLYFWPPGGLNQFKKFNGFFEYSDHRASATLVTEPDLHVTAGISYRTLLALAQTISRPDNDNT